MAHITNQKQFQLLASRLQNAMGLDGKKLKSIDATLSLGPDELAETTVKYVEFIDLETEDKLMDVLCEKK